MAFVYDAIDKDVGKELRKKNPNPHFKKNHHQWLKEFGKDKLIGQIQRVITIMKLCTYMADFRQKFSRVFDKSPFKQLLTILTGTTTAGRSSLFNQLAADRLLNNTERVLTCVQSRSPRNSGTNG